MNQQAIESFFKPRGTSKSHAAVKGIVDGEGQAIVRDKGGTIACDARVADKDNLESETDMREERDPLPLVEEMEMISVVIKEGVPFSELCRVMEQIEATTKRLEINAILANFFEELMRFHPQDLVTAVHLSLSRLGPAHEGIELGVGESLLIKAIAQATGRSILRIKREIEEKGDIGLVAEVSRATQQTMLKPAPLTLATLFKSLKEIATTTGRNAMLRKTDKVQALFVACRGHESRYLFRLLEGKLRIGLAEQSVLTALAVASTQVHPTETSEPVILLKSAYNTLPDYNAVIPALLTYGIDGLSKHCQLTPGIPLKPMLAFPTRSITEVLDRFEKVPFTCEFKYDGERAQIHHPADGCISIYSRNSENISQKYPDIMEKIGQVAKPSVQSYVLDCEVVAYDPLDKRLLPFQILSTRKRKDVKTSSINVKVCLFAFDLLYLNGRPLIECSLQERRQLLYEHFNNVPGEFHFAQHVDAHSLEEIQTFLEQAVKSGCEGLMVKTLESESSYEPSKRSRKWLKIKKDYLDGIGDSLDLVVIGGYAGRGKRTGVYGGYLLACYDPDADEYQTICKIGTGFSEVDLEEQALFLKDHIICSPKPYYRYTDSTKPDVWFEPVWVWEVKAADFSISPVYTAAWGLVEMGKGISLRFPRFIRLRQDKSPENATPSEQISELYRNQILASTTNNHTISDEEY